MNNLQRDVVRDILNGIVIICMIIIISVGFALVVTSEAHASECYVCGCATPEVETVEIKGNAL